MSEITNDVDNGNDNDNIEIEEEIIEGEIEIEEITEEKITNNIDIDINDINKKDIKLLECENEILKVLENLLDLYLKEDFDSIIQILNLSSIISISDTEPRIYKYDKQEIQFVVERNPCIDVRIYLSNEDEFVLNTIQLVTSKRLNENELSNYILHKWITENYFKSLPIIEIKKFFKLNKINKDKDKKNKKYIHLLVNEKNWEIFVKTCNNKGLLVQEGFYLALYNFIGLSHEIEKLWHNDRK